MAPLFVFFNCLLVCEIDLNDDYDWEVVSYFMD